VAKRYPLDLTLTTVLRIDNGRYWLWGIEAPQDVAAAYEHIRATYGRGVNAQRCGDLLVGWMVANTLSKGDFELGLRLRDALEALGWQPHD
jgi:hypothetical protein